MTSISPSPIIEYATGTVAFPHRYQRLALAASLPSLIVPFAPFVWDVSPWSAAQTLLNPDDFFDTLVIGLLGIGFFAAPTTFAWRALLTFGRQPRGIVRGVFLGLAAVAWTASIWINVLWCRAVVEQVKDGTSVAEAVSDAWPFIICVPLAAIGLSIAWRLHRQGDRDRMMSLLLMTPFLTTATSCLLGFRRDEWQWGYYVTMYLVLIWIIEIAIDGIQFARASWKREGGRGRNWGTRIRT